MTKTSKPKLFRKNLSADIYAIIESKPMKLNFSLTLADMVNPKPTLILLFVFLLCLNESLISLATNQISYSNPLTGNKTIISQDGNFELGFFPLGNKITSPNYYLGIWYKKLPERTPVWIANRNAPISDPSTSELTVSGNGNLILLDQNKTEIWSTNLMSVNSNSTIGELLGTGNLVLRESFGSTTSFLWQSIEHPTDTILPGAKFGKMKATGSQRLISWKNYFDPAEGIFSVELDPNGSSQLFIFWNRSKPFWKSGEWNGKYFNNIPEMNANFDSGRRLYNYISNENETYFTYWRQKDSVISRLVLDKSGQIKPMTWIEESQKWYVLWTQPQAPCDVYALCGPFGICNELSSSYCNCIKGFEEVNPRDWELGDPSGGCQRNSPLQCINNNSYLPNVQTDKFYEMPSVGLPDNLHLLYTNNAEDCEWACLENCSCNAYAYSNNSCSVWYGDLLNLRQESDVSSGKTLFIRLSASEFNQKMNKKKVTTWAFIGSAIGFVAFVFFIYLLVRRYQRRKFIFSMNALENGLASFRYGDLRTITNNFSELLGRGSFGSVFKGTLPNSSKVAVKRLESTVQVGEKQFRVEVSTIGIIQHVNLVRLRGYCSEKDKRLLVYDYMPNGSLDQQLFRSSTLLNWKTRYQIALGVARGLAYLHESCLECIIHCDVKPENILLDELFVPKIADFGLAKLVGRDFSRVLTTTRGTIGYIAPEWIAGTAISSKTDVYSYGMVLLEIISGRRNSHQLGGESVYFPLMVAIELNEGNSLALLDHRLNGDANLGEVERVCRVACWCIQDEEHNRPTMGQVVQILEGLFEVSVPPVPMSLKSLMDYSGSLDFMREHSLAQSCPADSVASNFP